ncbi:MAG TPA: hypothetical protein VFY36_01390, partial [Solirubrobacteraceae bacterium]|nr:hypothetical protein [Solirubrobacteraceae bacterium]
MLVAILLLTLAGAAPARAMGPRWQIFSSSIPTNLPPGGEGKVFVSVTNIGDGSVNAAITPVTITDVLPPGLTPVSIASHTFVQGLEQGSEGTPCSLSPMPTCTFSGPEPFEPALDVLGPLDGIMELNITVKVEKPLGTVASLPNEVRVEGGGIPPKSVARTVTVNGAETQFGIEQYEFIPENEDGSTDTQAGSHPFQLTSTLGLNTTFGSGFEGPAALPKDLHVALPPGLVGNPGAVPQCTSV